MWIRNVPMEKITNVKDLKIGKIYQIIKSGYIYSDKCIGCLIKYCGKNKDNIVIKSVGLLCEDVKSCSTFEVLINVYGHAFKEYTPLTSYFKKLRKKYKGE